jgi:CelD/BcsL family acetyltransferase involved in cellulose biosynthesis
VIRYSRKLALSHHCEFKRVETEEELESGLDALVRLHQARWESLGEPGSFALPGFEAFLREAARRSFLEGRLRLWTLSLDGRVAAAMIAFVDGGVVYGFQQGFDPTYVKNGLGRILSSFCLKACVEDDLVREFDFMGGERNRGTCNRQRYLEPQRIQIECARTSDDNVSKNEVVGSSSNSGFNQGRTSPKASTPQLLFLNRTSVQ